MAAGDEFVDAAAARDAFARVGEEHGERVAALSRLGRARGSGERRDGARGVPSVRSDEDVAVEVWDAREEVGTSRTERVLEETPRRLPEEGVTTREASATSGLRGDVALVVLRNPAQSGSETVVETLRRSRTAATRTLIAVERADAKRRDEESARVANALRVPLENVFATMGTFFDDDDLETVLSKPPMSPGGARRSCRSPTRCASTSASPRASPFALDDEDDDADDEFASLILHAADEGAVGRDEWESLVREDMEKCRQAAFPRRRRGDSRILSSSRRKVGDTVRAVAKLSLREDSRRANQIQEAVCVSASDQDSSLRRPSLRSPSAST